MGAADSFWRARLLSKFGAVDREREPASGVGFQQRWIVWLGRARFRPNAKVSADQTNNLRVLCGEFRR